MNLLHCPLCIGLAILSVLRAMSHLTLATLRLAPSPFTRRDPAGRPQPNPRARAIRGYQAG
jgi:hypothetical protein